MRPTYCQVDLGAIAQNTANICQSLTPGTKLMAVVKADGYGHGAFAVAKTALRNGAFALGIATVEEGRSLREGGIHAPIVILGALLPDDFQGAIAAHLDITVFDAQTVIALESMASILGIPARVHVKIDTGMGRIGLRNSRELAHLLETIQGCPNLQLAGIFTHFANADGADKSFAKEQNLRFLDVIDNGLGRTPCPLLHAANSAATLAIPTTHHHMVRIGIALYGYYPSPNIPRDVKLKPAMSVHTKVTQVKQVAAGETISYDRTVTLWRPTMVATLPIGYGDGYRRAFSGKGCVLINGCRAPVLGRVCMDQTMVDVTDIPDVAPGTPVVVLGRQGQEEITADEMAEWAGTISYEILLGFNTRVDHRYI